MNVRVRLEGSRASMRPHPGHLLGTPTPCSALSLSLSVPPPPPPLLPPFCRSVLCTVALANAESTRTSASPLGPTCSTITLAPQATSCATVLSRFAHISSPHLTSHSLPLPLPLILLSLFSPLLLHLNFKKTCTRVRLQASPEQTGSPG